MTLDDLKLYPRLSYEQGEHNAFYFSEEILSTLDSKRTFWCETVQLCSIC